MNRVLSNLRPNVHATTSALRAVPAMDVMTAGLARDYAMIWSTKLTI